MLKIIIALHRSAREGNTHGCRLLLSYGADMSIVSLQGYTAVQVATEAVQKILNENQTPSSVDVEYQLLEASKAGDLDLVKKIVTAHPQVWILSNLMSIYSKLF